MDKKPETYLVTFEITSETDPAEWDWNELLDLGVRESSYVHYIGQITRNNQRESKEMGDCDKCGNAYELSSRDNRCGDCGNCSGCCTHEREGE